MPDLQQQFGQIDIYLFDQLLRGRIRPGMRVLDTGCGSGRNLVYFLREAVASAVNPPEGRQSVSAATADRRGAQPRSGAMMTRSLTLHGLCPARSGAPSPAGG
jgi:hypothetical protein